MTTPLKPSLQDFSTINTYVDSLKKDYGFVDSSNAFYYVALNLIMNLQDDEILDSITDNHFLNTIGEVSGHDRGIDAVIIDESCEKAIIHFFNFKYATTFEKTKDHIPSNEIDKILSFLNSLMSEDADLKKELNPALFSKVEEIWEIFEKQNPNFVFHICSNYYNSFEPSEKDRFEKGIHRHSNFEVKYHIMPDLVKFLTKQGKKIVDANIRAIDKNFFEKSDGDIRALIVNIDCKDLLRCIIDNDELRSKPDIEDYSILKTIPILEDAFEDNIRVYLKQKTSINQNIKNTALSDEAHRFFYYNNGITITCSSFSYPKTQRAPIVEITNLQVVNGSQTLHALYEAFCEDDETFSNIDILCRIYQIQKPELTTRIAEYTNSQNPVSSRDIRSIDYIQQKLEKELFACRYYYERKFNQYLEMPRNQRIDAEKVGQVLMAFYNGLPSEAKEEKRYIFAEKYEDIFNSNITADKVLLAYKLFQKIEFEKDTKKVKFIKGIDDQQKGSYSTYSSYWVLYFLGEFAKHKKIELKLDNIEQIWSLQTNVLLLIENLIQLEKDYSKQKNLKYSHMAFFKHNRPKKLYEDMNEDEIKALIEM